MARSIEGMKFVTSVVPALQRIAPDGRNVGPSYQLGCLETWLDSGAEIISLNMQAEIQLCASILPGRLRCTATDRSSGLYPNRYGPTLGHAFDATDGAEFAGLFNADTFIPVSVEFGPFLKSKIRDHFILSRRTDVEAAGGRFLGINESGIDAVFFDRKRFAPLFGAPDLRRFQMGVPWWDLIIPVAASFYGPLGYIPEPFLMHMDHPKAWSGESYREAGEIACDTILRHAEEAASFSVEAASFARQFSELRSAQRGKKQSKQLFECRQFYLDWIWQRAAKYVVSPPGFMTDPVVLRSLAETLNRREPASFKLTQLDRTPYPNLVLKALNADLAHAFRLTGRHLERWCRYKIRGKSFQESPATYSRAHAPGLAPLH